MAVVAWRGAHDLRPSRSRRRASASWATAIFAGLMPYGVAGIARVSGPAELLTRRARGVARAMSLAHTSRINAAQDTSLILVQLTSHDDGISLGITPQERAHG